MSRSHSVERDDKPLPPVPPQTLSVVESVSTSATDRARQTLKKMSQDIPTTEYRSPLNIAGRVKNGLSDMTREILVPHAGRATHHRDHSDHKREPEDSLPPESIPPAQPEDRDRERITSSEKIRRQWEESQRSPERQGSSHHHSSSRSHGELHRHKSTTAPPTAFRSEGFPWGFGSREHGQTSRSNSFRSKHRRERSEETPPQDEIYERSDGSGHSSDRLEIHNATPIYEGDEMKLRGRPSLGTRFRTSLQRLGVGATRPAQHRTDISRSPSPNGSRRSPSPEFWRKRSPHSSIRATEQYNTPRPAGIPDTLPRIESQKIDWEQPINRDTQSPSRPPDDAIPTIPDLVTPGIHHEHGPRGVPILEPTKPRPVEAPEHPPSHHIEASQATSTTAVNPPAPDDEYRDTMGDRPVLHNYDGPYHTHESYPEGPGRLKRLLSLNSKPIPVPIEGDDNGPAHTTYASPPRPKVYNATPAGIIRSTSLIRTRSRRKDSTKRKERRVDPDLHVGYESDPWGEGQEILRDAHGNRVFPEAPKRKMSQKKKPNASGPTKIALPMGQVEEFHSVHSNSPTDPVPLDPVSNDPIMLEGHKRTTSTSTFHTAQSGVTRPGSPTRKLSSQSTQQAKLAAPDMKHDRWRRSRSGAPRRPSETLLTTTSSNGNQYADEAPTMHDQQPLFTEPDHEYEQERPEPRHDLPPIPPLLPAPGRRTPSPLPTSTHRSQSPLPNVTHRSQSPLPNTSRRTPSPLPNVMYRSHSPVPPPPPPAVQIQVTRPTLPQAPIPAPVPVPPAPGPVPGSSRVPVPSQAPPHAPSPDFMRTPAPQATLPAYSGYAPTSAHASPSQGYRPLPEKPPIPQDPVVNAPPPAASAAIERVPWANSPPIRTPPPREPVIHASPEQSPPIRTPRAQTPSIDDRHIHIYPSELPESPEYEDDPRHRPHIDTHAPAGSDMRSPAIDTPYVLPRMPTPTLQSPGVYVQPPSGVTSPTIDHQLSPGDDSPSRSIRIEGEDQPDRLDRLDRLDRPDRPERAERPQTSSMLSSRPMTRQLAALSITDQQQRQLNRQTGSEMSFVTVEPLSKREKLAASVLSISSMPWLRNRTLSRAHPYDSYYHSTQDGDSRYYDRHPRHPTDYYSSPTPPQLPPVGTATTPIAPRPEVGKLPSWYPREQAARAAASTPQERESRGPRIGQEAWGWRSSPHHGIPEENEDVTPSTNMPPWPYASGVVTPGPELPNDLVRGESMMTPPVLPPRPVVRAPEPAGRPSGEKKRVPKYRIEQDERGHPVLVPEPGFEDNRWTVFEIGGVEFKRAPGTEEATRVPQWVPKRLSGLRRPDSHRPPYEHQYSDSPAPIHAPLEGRQNDT